MSALNEVFEKEIKRLHKVSRSKDVIIQSAIDIINELLNRSDMNDEQKETYSKEVNYFKENLG